MLLQILLLLLVHNHPVTKFSYTSQCCLLFSMMPPEVVGEKMEPECLFDAVNILLYLQVRINFPQHDKLPLVAKTYALRKRRI